LRGRRFPVDLRSPLQRDGFQLGVRHHLVDRAHRVHLLGGVFAAQEEDLPGEFLADQAREVGRAVAAVERAHVGVGLLEPGVLGAGQREIADHVQGMPAAGRPPGDHRDDDLGHEPDQPLHLQDVQPPGARGIHALGGVTGRVLVPGAAADPLIPARAEGPAAVLRARPVPGEQDATDVTGHPGVLQRPVELVDRVRAERVAHLGPVEGDPHGGQVDVGAARGRARAGADMPVVGDVGEVETLDLAPAGRVEDRAHGCGAHAGQPTSAAPRIQRPGVSRLSGRPQRGCLLDTGRLDLHRI